MEKKIIVLRFTPSTDIPLVEYLNNRSEGLVKFFSKWEHIYISIDEYDVLDKKINDILDRMEIDLKPLNSGKNHSYRLEHQIFTDCNTKKIVNSIKNYVLIKDDKWFADIRFEELNELKIE